jgi:YVTN family beta-propeller protein
MQISRPRWRRGAVALLALALAVALAPSARAADQPARPVLFVGNVWDGTVTLIDAGTLRVIRTLNVTPDGKTPQDPVQAAVYPALIQRGGPNYVQGLAPSPDGQILYVSRGYLGDVAAFDLRSGAMLWRLQIDGVRADHVALSPDGQRLYVSALTANKVEVIDTRSHQVIGSFATGDWPHVIEFSPDAKTVYVGSLGNQLLPSGLDGRHELTAADPNTLAVKARYTFDAGVRPFVFTADGATAYIQLSYLSGFVVFDMSAGKIVRTVALPVTGPGASMQPSDYPNQAAHHGIALSLDEKTICDAGTISDYAALVDRASLATLAIVPTGSQPAEAITSLDGRYCFLTDRGPSADSVSVVSYAQRKEVARIPVGQHPQEEELAIVPDSVLGL